MIQWTSSLRVDCLEFDVINWQEPTEIAAKLRQWSIVPLVTLMSY